MVKGSGGDPELCEFFQSAVWGSYCGPMRVSSFMAALAALIVTAGVVAGCGSSSNSSSSETKTVDSSQISLAAFHSQKVPGFKFALDGKVSVADQDVSISGSGAFDTPAKRMEMSVDAAGVSVDELIDGTTIYIKIPGGESTFGTPWAKADLKAISPAAASSISGGSTGGTDPSQMLSLLKAAGTVKDAGTEDVRGTSSKHYHVIVDLDKAAAKQSPAARAALSKFIKTYEKTMGSHTLPMEVYVGDNRVTRISFALDVCTAQGKAHTTISMDLYDYGKQSVAEPPPADQVTDITDKLKDTLDQGQPTGDC